MPIFNFFSPAAASHLPLDTLSFFLTLLERNQAESEKDWTEKGGGGKKTCRKIPAISAISVGVSTPFSRSQRAVRGGSRDRVPRRSSSASAQPARPACTNTITAANAQNVMK